MDNNFLNITSLLEQTNKLSELSQVMANFNTTDFQNWKNNNKATNDAKAESNFKKDVTSHNNTSTHSNYYSPDYSYHSNNNPHSNYSPHSNSSPHSNGSSHSNSSPHSNYKPHSNYHSPHSQVNPHSQTNYHSQAGGYNGTWHNNSPWHANHIWHGNAPYHTNNNYHSNSKPHSNSSPHSNSKPHTNSTSHSNYSPHSQSHNNSKPHANTGFDHTNFIPTKPTLYNLNTNDKLKDTVTIGWYSYDRNTKPAGSTDVNSKTPHYKVELRKISGSPTVGWTVKSEDTTADTLTLNTKDPFGLGWTNLSNSEGTYELRITPFNPKKSENGVTKEYIGDPQTVQFTVKQNTLPTISVTNAIGEFVNFTFGDETVIKSNGSVEPYNTINIAHPADKREGIFVAITMKDVDISNYQKGVVRLETSGGTLIASQNIIWQNGSDKIQSNNSNVTGFAFIPKASYLGKGTVIGARVEVEVGDYLDSACTQAADTIKKVQDVISDSNNTVMIFNINKTAPVVTLTNLTSGVTQQHQYRMDATKQASGAELASYRYAWTTSATTPDNNTFTAWMPISNGNSFSTTFTKAESGQWYLHVQVKDALGNVTSKSSTGALVDNIPPIAVDKYAITKDLGLNIVKLQWGGFAEHTQADLGFTVISSGFGKLRIYAQEWNGTNWVDTVDIDGNGTVEPFLEFMTDITQYTFSKLKPGGIYRIKIDYYDKAGNLAQGKWKLIYMSTDQVKGIRGNGYALEWDQNAGRGYIEVAWDPVASALGYYVHIHDGYTYRKYDVGTNTTWTSKDAGLYPSESELNSYSDNSQANNLFKNGVSNGGLNLRDNPQNLYRATAGTTRDNVTSYKIAVTAYNENGEMPLDETAEKEFTIPTSTDLTPPTMQISPKEIAMAPDGLSANIYVQAFENGPGQSGLKGIYDLNKTPALFIPASNLYAQDYTLHVTENGTYRFMAEDNVGRTKEVQVTIDGINSPVQKMELYAPGVIDTIISLPANEAAAKYIYNWGSSNAEPNKNVVGTIKETLNSSGGDMTLKLLTLKGNILTKDINVEIYEGADGNRIINFNID